MKIKIFLLAIFLLFFSSAFLFFYVNISPVSKVTPYKIKEIEIFSGTSIKEAADKLKSENLIRNSSVFYFFVRFPVFYKFLTGSKKEFVLKSGFYKIDDSMSLKKILTVLSDGRSESVKITFPEGLTISKISQKLEKEKICTSSAFKEASKNKVLLKKYNIFASSFEGYLFPDTYFFIPFMNAEDVVSSMADNFFKQIKDIPAFQKKSSEEINRIVILASIVEREYRVAEEAALIAGVFENRLKSKMGLYSCATVEYVITEINGRPHPDVITYADLSLENPYNTYKFPSLPPGAISNPGKIALAAAAEPAKTDCYYFRLEDPILGKHVFSRDFSSHISAGYNYRTKKIGY